MKLYFSTQRRAKIARDFGLFLSVFLTTWSANGDGFGLPALSAAASVAAMAVVRSLVPVPKDPTE